MHEGGVPLASRRAVCFMLSGWRPWSAAPLPVSPVVAERLDGPARRHLEERLEVAEELPRVRGGLEQDLRLQEWGSHAGNAFD